MSSGEDFDDIFGEDAAAIPPSAGIVSTTEFDDLFGDDSTPTTVAGPQQGVVIDAAAAAAVAPKEAAGGTAGGIGSPMDESQQKAFLDWLDDAPAASAAPPAAADAAAAATTILLSPSRLPPPGPGRPPRPSLSPPRRRPGSPPNSSSSKSGVAAQNVDPLMQLRELAAGRRVETDVEYIRGLCTSLGGALPTELRAPLWGPLLGRPGGSGGDTELSDWLAAGGMVGGSGGSGGGTGNGALPDHLELRSDCLALARRLQADGVRPAASAAAAAAAAADVIGVAPEGELPPLPRREYCGDVTEAEELELAEEIQQVVSFYCRRRRTPYEPVLCALVGPLFALGLGKQRVAALLPPLAHGLTLFLATGLSPEVRSLATKHAHRRFRFLVAYHSPQLAQHLDRSYPGWEMPRPEAGESTHETQRLDEEAAALVDDIMERTPSRSRRRSQGESSVGSAGRSGATSPAGSLGAGEATFASGMRALGPDGGPSPGAAAASGTPRARDGDDDSADGTREFVLGRCRVPEAESEGLVPPSLLTALFAALGGRVRPAAMLPLWDYYLVRGDRHFGYFLLLALLLRRKDELLQLQGPLLHAALAEALSGDPRTGSGTPRAAGGTPRAAGGTPRAAGGTPRAAGGTPRAAGASERSSSGGSGGGGIGGDLDEDEVHHWCFEAEALDRATPESFRLHLGLIPEVAEAEHAALLHQQRLDWEQQRRERAAAEAAEEEADAAAAAAAAAAEAAAIAAAADAEVAEAAARAECDEDVPSMFAADFIASNGGGGGGGHRSSASSASTASATSASTAGSKRLLTMGRMMQAAGSKLAARVREDSKALSAAMAASGARGSKASDMRGKNSIGEAPETPLELLMPQMCLTVGAMEAVASIGRREGSAGGNSTPTPPAGGRRSRRHMQLHRPRKELPFFAVDCRSKEEVAQGRFPTAYQLDPSTMDDPEELSKLLDLLEPLTGRVHVVLIGSGVAAAAVRALPPGAAASPANEALRKAMRDDYSYVTTCALFFVKRGFPYVSVLAGGYAAAHDLLAASSVATEAATEAAVAGMGLSTLVDHNAARCVLCARAAQRRRLPDTILDVAAAAAGSPPAAAATAAGGGGGSPGITGLGSPPGRSGEAGVGQGRAGNGGSAFRFQGMDAMLFNKAGGRDRSGSAPAVKSMEELGQRFKKLSFSGMSGSRKSSVDSAGGGGNAAAVAAAATAGGGAQRPSSLKSGSFKGLLAQGLRRAGSAGSAGYGDDPAAAAQGMGLAPPNAPLSKSASPQAAAAAGGKGNGGGGMAAAAARAKQQRAAAAADRLRIGANVEEKFFVIGGDGDSSDGDEGDRDGATNPKALALLEHRLSGLVKEDKVCLSEYHAVPGAMRFEVAKRKGEKELPRTIFLTRERIMVVAAAAAEGGDALAAAAVAAGRNDAANGGSAAAAAVTADVTESSDAAPGASESRVLEGDREEEPAEALCVIKSNHHLTQLQKMTFLRKEPLLITLHFRRTVPVPPPLAAAAGAAPAASPTASSGAATDNGGASALVADAGAAAASGASGGAAAAAVPAAAGGDSASGESPSSAWVEEVRKNVYRLQSEDEKTLFISSLQQHLQRFRG